MKNVVELKWPETANDELESFCAALQYMAVEALKLGYEDTAIYVQMAIHNLPRSDVESETSFQ